MADNKDLKNIFNTLDELLGSVDISDVSAEGAGFSQLKDGYYLCEVKKAELKISKASKLPMAAFQLKVVEDGTTFSFDSKANMTEIKLKGTKGRTIFKYFTLKDEASIQRFASDMLKFEGDTPGEPLLTKDYFLNSELIEDALEVLVGMRIYVHNSVTINEDDTTSTWVSFMSWKNAEKTGLKV